MALQGTLGDFGIADIFQLIGQQQKTGVLHLQAKEDDIRIHFKEGNVVRAESATRQQKDKLGHLLVRAGLISAKQLEDGLGEQRRTLRRLGDILVEKGYLTEDDLKQMTFLQTTETLYWLFGWKQGSYAFEQGEVELDSEAINPIRSESILMEGFRRVDEWPAVRKIITSNAMTFMLLKEPPAASKKDDEDDFNLDAAFGEGDGGDDDGDKKGGLGKNERKILSIWRPERTVQQYVDLSRLGDFEASKALVSLVRTHYFKPVQPAKKDEKAAQLAITKPLGERLREGVGSAMATVLLVVSGLFIYGQAGAGSSSVSGTWHIVEPAAQRLLSPSQMLRIETAVGIYELEHGDVPESLDALTQEGLLKAGDLQFPWSERYYYQRTSAHTYVLLPPLR